MTALRVGLVAALLLAAGPAPAQSPTMLALPVGTVETASVIEDPGAYKMPVGRFGPQVRPVLDLEGRVVIRALRVPPDRADTLSLIRALRPQLAAAGFEPLFECAARACGGFDFRFNTRVLPPPAMEFDLTDFRYIGALRQGSDPAHLAILISRSPRGGHVQTIEVRRSDTAVGPLAQPGKAEPPVPAEPQTTSVADPDGRGLDDILARSGRAILEGIDFATGGRSLDDTEAAALAPLAEVLRGDPEMELILVGHTDDTGTLAANIALSLARAEAVRAALINRYGIAAQRLSAEGVGFLAPRAANTTDEGRAANRRVEAVLR